MKKNVSIRNALDADQPSIMDVIVSAFGDAEGREIADLVSDLAADPSAQPSLSLVATENNRIVGHILFTNARINDARRPIPSSILAPLAVHPDYQDKGLGGQLIAEGLKQLRAAGTDLVFVLGHPGYYPKHGFITAGTNGFDAPHPILPEDADAWMVQELRPGILGQVHGQVICANALDDPRHWRE